MDFLKHTTPHFKFLYKKIDSNFINLSLSLLIYYFYHGGVGFSSPGKVVSPGLPITDWS